MLTLGRTVLAVVFLTGCATLPPPPPERQPLVVNASFGRTWDAVIDVFSSRNIPIRTLDRTSGLLVAEKVRVSRGDEATWANCPNVMTQVLMGVGVADPMLADYNIVVRGDSTRSTVRTSARFMKENLECTSKGTLETAIEARVKVRAESTQ